MRMTVRLEGAERILRNTDTARLIGPPWRRMMERSALHLESLARKNAPKWRRTLTNAIESQVDRGAIPLEAKVGILAGPALAYAKAMEFGRKPGKFPPIAAIAEWAHSKGVAIPPFVIARAIARGRSKHQRMGGFKYLTRAFESGRRRVQDFLNDAARDIESAWRAR